MKNYKKEVLINICYTKLVYGRISKKLSTSLSKDEIEKMILDVLGATDESQFQKRGKNIYITNYERSLRITVNSFTYRIITVDALNKRARLPT
ncbi:DUF3781 domain-containing protein [Cytophagaceae bacterium ABcell3]|nr:DUF3781 domain-containing protein [Cytophagaceae bacterium ABcell3]